MVTEVREVGGAETLGEGTRMASGEKLYSMTWVGVSRVCSLHKRSLRGNTYNLCTFLDICYTLMKNWS